MKKDIYAKLEKKLRARLLSLPDFAADFIESLENTREIRTRIEYAKDIQLFLDFIKEDKGVEVVDIPLLNKLTERDFRNYLNYLSSYEKTYISAAGKEVRQVYENSDSSKSRKLASIHELFERLFLLKDLDKDISANIKVHVRQKAKIKSTLTPEELERLFQVILDEENIESQREKAFASKLKYRDYTICSLLAYSGIRVGEIVQMDMQDVSIGGEVIVVTRKGGDQEKIPLPEKVLSDIEDYLVSRAKIETKDPALFLSLQKKRINERTINNLLDKYGKRAGFDIKLTPHVFRRTFGTAHYNTYGDISLTGTLLGHKSTETTKKFYAKVSDERIRKSMQQFTYDRVDELRKLVDNKGFSLEDLKKLLINEEKEPK